MSTITQLICRNFGGIREKNAVFTEEMISAQDIQNVELYFTGINNGVGIRTMKGNLPINSELAGEKRIVEIFESVQKGQKHFFVYATNTTEGVLYNLNMLTLELEVIKEGLTVTTNAQGVDVIQGWSDLFFFTNGVEMFTVEMGKLRQLYAFKYDTKIIYADSSTAPTQLYNANGNEYTGNDWVISGTDVNYNGNTASYSSDDNISFANTVVDMKPKDRDNRDVIGLGCAIYANRLFIFNKNVLWYSVTSNIYDFATADAEWTTSAGYIELLKDLTAIHPYLDSLALFYSDSSALLSVQDGVFAISEESPAGCAGINSLIFHDTNLYFYDNTKKSVFSFKQVISGQKTLGENIAVDIQEILQDIEEDRLNEIKTLSVFTEGRNEIWWILPITTTYTHIETVDGEKVETQEPASYILIYDYLKGEWVKRKSQKINTVAVVDNKLYSGSEDGNVLEEYTTDLFNGQYIDHHYDCVAWNLGAMNTLKVLVLPPRVSFGMPYSNSFYVKYVKNYNIFKKSKIKLIKSKLKNYMRWGVGYWGADYWLSKNTNVIGKFPNATFKVVEISIYTENSSQNFAIRNIEFSKIKVKQV